MRPALIVPLLFAAVGATSSCGSAARTEPAADKTAISRQAIINGADDDSSNDDVVRLFAMGTACSATLIAPNLIVTARHCVSTLEDDAFTCNADGTSSDAGATVTGDLDPASLLVFTGVEANQATSATAVGAQLIVPISTTTCSADIAFLVLASDIDLPYRNVRRTPAAVGDVLTVVGYGLTGKSANPELPETTPDRRQIRSGVAVTIVGPAPAWWTPIPSASRISRPASRAATGTAVDRRSPPTAASRASSHAADRAARATASSRYSPT